MAGLPNQNVIRSSDASTRLLAHHLNGDANPYLGLASAARFAISSALSVSLRVAIHH